MATIQENLQKLRSIFGKRSPVDRERVEPYENENNPPLEQENIEIIEVEDQNLALQLHYSYEIDQRIGTIQQAIIKYRELSKYSEIEEAIQEITDEAVVKDFDGKIVELNLAHIEDSVMSKNIKDKIYDEFDRLLKIMKWNFKADHYFKQWYIDGRAYFQIFFDHERPELGITNIRFINPKFLTKVLVRDKEANRNRYYYFYKPDPSENNIGFSTYVGMTHDEKERFEPKLIPEEHLIFIPSGFIDYELDMYISYLHKAIKPYNNLRDIEDSAVIYRLTRAPERRVFYVDVGKMPPTKAEQYVSNLMRKFQNKIVYDTTNGQLNQRKNTVSMIEDFWLPTTSDGRGTKIETLQGGQQLGEIDDIQYFYKKLLKSLKVPPSRFDTNERAYIRFSNNNELDREELRFAKFINKLRDNYSGLFHELLRRQLVLKKIITSKEYRRIQDDIVFDWSKDLHYEAAKNRELLKETSEILDAFDGYVGKYISQQWIYENVFQFTEDEQTKERQQIDKEKAAGIVDFGDDAAAAAGLGGGGGFGGGESGPPGGGPEGGDLGEPDLGGPEGGDFGGGDLEGEAPEGEEGIEAPLEGGEELGLEFPPETGAPEEEEDLENL